MSEQPAWMSKARGEPARDPAAGVWQQRAAFTVFFESVSDPGAPPSWRTRVYHEESGEEQLLAGGLRAPWADWITGRLFAGPGDAEPGPGYQAPATVHVTAVRPTAAPRAGSVSDEIHLVAEVTISGLAGLGAELVMALFTGEATRSPSAPPSPPRAPTSSPRTD